MLDERKPERDAVLWRDRPERDVKRIIRGQRVHANGDGFHVEALAAAVPYVAGFAADVGMEPAFLSAR